MNSNKSYAQILRASSIMGGASAISLLLGMVRVKFVAILIGTTGVGLAAGFTSISGLLGTLFGLGIQSSAVREVAVAVGKGDEQLIGRALLTLRRVCWLTGLIGMVAMMLLSPILSKLTFGNRDYTLDIAALGVVIFFANVYGGQMALIQGARRIGDLARVNVMGGVISTLIAIPFYSILGLRGIVPAMVCIAAVQCLVAWFFTRRVSVPKVSMVWRETLDEARGMLSLGVVFMFTALMASAVSYFAITLISNKLNLQSVGLYSAAFALSGVFVNFVLAAMGSDYYPRLTAAVEDKSTCNRLINEQTEIGLLLATPGLLATMAFAPWVVKLFYSVEFLPAVKILQFFVLGCLGRLISWPLAFLVLAAGKSSWLFFSELFMHVLHAVMLFAGLTLFGLNGVAIAFVALYAIHIPLAWLIARHISGFGFSGEARKLILLMSLLHILQLILTTNSNSQYAFTFSLIIVAFGVAIFVLGIKSRDALPWRQAKPSSGSLD